MEPKDDFETAWKCLLSSCSKHAEETAKEKGAGICVYKLLRDLRSDGTNCEFWYADYKSREWERIIQSTGYNGMTTQKKYFICLQIPVGERGDYYISDMRSFTFDKNIQIIKEENSFSQGKIRRRKNKDIKDN